MHDDLLTPCTQKKGDLATSSLALDSDKNDADPPAPRRPMGGDMINYFKPPHSILDILDASTLEPRHPSQPSAMAASWQNHANPIPGLCKTTS
jgi:hypothetical protein